MDWIYLTNEVTGGTTRVADEPGVVEWHEAHGWARADEPEPAPFVPPKDIPLDQEWVELVHPGLDGARHDWPNNPEALQGAYEAGWQLPDPEPDPETKPAKKAAAKKAAESANDQDEE